MWLTCSDPYPDTGLRFLYWTYAVQVTKT